MCSSTRIYLAGSAHSSDGFSFSTLLFLLTHAASYFTQLWNVYRCKATYNQVLEWEGQANAVGDQRTKNSVWFGEGIVQEAGLEVGLEKDMIEYRRTIQATVMLWAKGKSQNESGLFQGWSGNCVLWIWVGDKAGKVDWKAAGVAWRSKMWPTGQRLGFCP